MRPAYISYDTKQREELLSQSGNFGPPEREVFHALCKNYQERIPYDRIVGTLSREGSTSASDLVSLMHKLRAAHMGVLRTAIKDGRRVNDAVILTERDGPQFFVELVDELFTDLLESIESPIPLLSSVEENYGDIPRNALEEVPATEIGQYFSGRTESHLPLSIPALDGERLIITQRQLRSFVNVAVLKMRYFLSSTTLLGALAKLMDTSLINLKQQCAGKDASFWLRLTERILERRGDLEASRSINVSPNFFQVTSLLRDVIRAQISEAKLKKEQEEGRQLDLDAIAMSIKSSDELWMPQAEVIDLLEGQKEKYGEDYDRFREEFYERYVHSRTRNALPTIVLLKGRYIHRDNVFPLFIEEFRRLQDELAVHFSLEMQEQLKRGSRSGSSTFYTLDNFNSAIQDQVEARSAYVAAMIEKPSILAEGMILHLKQNKIVKDVEQLKQRLAIYFNPDTMQALPLNEWFDLRPLGLFERAFEQLPLVKRLWIRITGKYESFRGRFLGQSVAQATQGVGAASAGRGAREQEREVADPKDVARRARERQQARLQKSGKQSSSSRARSSSSRSDQSHRAPASSDPAVKRAYSKKQVDSAWEEFNSTIRKGSS